MGAVPPTGLVVRPTAARDCQGIPWTPRRRERLANEVGENQCVSKNPDYGAGKTGTTPGPGGGGTGTPGPNWPGPIGP